eukprot:1160515-Pelagomonas_calceolata.AAC.1
MARPAAAGSNEHCMHHTYQLLELQLQAHARAYMYKYAHTYVRMHMYDRWAAASSSFLRASFQLAVMASHWPVLGYPRTQTRWKLTALPRACRTKGNTRCPRAPAGIQRAIEPPRGVNS